MEELTVNPIISHYRILSKLGAGGMGEVYRARDTKLNRDVAIKILPTAFAQDEERIGRFKREAQVLASLNHPTIAAIYGIEESDGIRALVMELVEGPTLADRIAAGPIPLDEALTIARQIAEALEVAHERGIIHRDLKPANVKLTLDDKVKVLDFGLAKLSSNETPSNDLSHSPTMIQGTQAGMILGTAPYMSPEQAKGKIVDKRADIWAFGCLLFEMLSGKQTFTGETLTETLAAVVRDDPDWDALPPGTPDATRRLLRRCLTKDQKTRLRDIGEARITIEELETGEPRESTEQTTPKAAKPLRRGAAWFAGIALALLVGGAVVWFFRPASSEMPLRKLELQVSGMDLSSNYAYNISPNGRSIAYVSNQRLWIRDLDRLQPREVPNSENAGHPFWSPDSAYLGFVIGKKMWKVSSDGSWSSAIADLPDILSGAGSASWGSDGDIIFTTGFSGLMKVPAQGGDPSPMLNVGADEADFHDAQLLPDGRGVLFLVHRSAGVDTIALFDGKTRKTLLQMDGQRLSNPVYCRTGHVLFSRRLSNAGIWAVPFSLDRLEVTGQPFLVVPDAVAPKVAEDGTLVFGYGESNLPTRLVWMDRTGRIVRNIQPEPLHQLPSLRLSPDGTRIVLATRESGKTDYWVVDLARGARSRLTFDNQARGWFCSWTPDGQRVLYLSGDAPAVYKVMAKAADGSGDAKELLNGMDAQYSPDGKFIVYATAEQGQRFGLWYAATSVGSKPAPFLVTPRDVSSPEFSPDGNYVAYVSDESEHDEVYIKPFPNGEGKWQVSVGGGAVPRWSRRGNELFFVAGNDLMAVPVRTKPSLVLGQPQKLFARQPIQADRPYGLYDGYDVTADGQHFVMLQSAEQQTINQTLTVVQNWFAEFKDRQKETAR